LHSLELFAYDTPWPWRGPGGERKRTDGREKGEGGNGSL
jgi:hypothetical protein